MTDFKKKKNLLHFVTCEIATDADHKQGQKPHREGEHDRDP